MLVAPAKAPMQNFRLMIPAARIDHHVGCAVERDVDVFLAASLGLSAVIQESHSVQHRPDNPFSRAPSRVCVVEDVRQVQIPIIQVLSWFNSLLELQPKE